MWLSVPLVAATGAVLFAGLHKIYTTRGRIATAVTIQAQPNPQLADYMRCIVRTCTPGTLTGAMIMDKGGIVEVEPCPDTGRVAVCGPVSGTPSP